MLTRRARWSCTSPMTLSLSQYLLSATECRPPRGTGTNQACAFVLKETDHGRTPAACLCCGCCCGGTSRRHLSGRRKSPLSMGQPGRASLPGDGEAGPAASQGQWSSGREGGPTHPRVKGRAGQAGHRGRAVQVDSWWPTGMSTRALPVVVPHKCPSHQEPGVADSRSQLRQHCHWRGLSLGQLSNSRVAFPHFQ